DRNRYQRSQSLQRRLGKRRLCDANTPNHVDSQSQGHEAEPVVGFDVNFPETEAGLQMSGVNLLRTAGRIEDGLSFGKKQSRGSCTKRFHNIRGDRVAQLQRVSRAQESLPQV